MLPHSNCFVTRNSLPRLANTFWYKDEGGKKELLYHKSILSTFVFNRFCDIKIALVSGCWEAGESKALSSLELPLIAIR